MELNKMETAGIFIMTAIFFGGIVLPVCFIFRLLKWMKNQTEIKKRTNILAVNICVMVAYSWILNADDLGNFIAWFMIGVTHLTFFLLLIELDLQKEKRHEQNIQSKINYSKITRHK